MSTAPIPVETLLAHREWVRAVAHAVVRDPNAADDVEQETWLAALRSPPRTASSLRGWFGAVTRSRARRIGRTDTRRGAREFASARRESQPSAAELAETADTHRRVVQAVVELDEPYREAILLRYFEGLAIGDVAVRSGVPLETARSRLKRGVARLRERLAEELGEDERPWHLALAPLLTKSHSAELAAGGAVMVASTTKTAAALGAVLLLIGGGAVVAANWAKDDGGPVAPAPGGPRAPVPYVAAAQEKPAAPPRQPRQRAEEQPAPAPPPKPAPTVLQKLDAAMMTPVWNQTPYTEVLGQIAAAADVEIALSQEVADRLDAREAIESLRLDQAVKARQVLDLATQLKGLRWVVEEPRVVIVPQDGKRDASKQTVSIPKWTPPAPLDVTGRVTDATGAAVAGARIVQVGRRGPAVAVTDAGGSYAARLAWPYGALEARAAGQVRSFEATVAGTPGTPVTLDFALRGAGGSLVVVTKSADGPLAGVEVVLGKPKAVDQDKRELSQQPLGETTDAEGVARFLGVPPGRVVVVCSREGYERLMQVVPIEVGPDVAVELTLVAKIPLGQKLDSQRISFNFQAARFGDVVKFINDAKGLNVILDPALAARSRDADVTLDLRDVSVRTALRSICDAVGGVTFEVREKEDIVFVRDAR